MNLMWLFLIIPAGLVLLLFVVYFFNLDMKLVSAIYKKLAVYHDKAVKETRL